MRTELTVKFMNEFSYEKPSYSGWGSETHYIYKFAAEDGSVYVWKTTKVLHGLKETPEGEYGYMIDKNGKEWSFVCVNKGDVIRIAATIKGESEYKGEKQIEINRVKVLDVVHKGKTKEERIKEKRQEQLNSLAGQDIVWTMPYKQYKERYSDCETLAGSFRSAEETKDVAVIGVIIREGRLKNSGVRGKHYSGYQFIYKLDGTEYKEVFRAVSEYTALKQLKKKHPDATDITYGQIFHYI